MYCRYFTLYSPDDFFWQHGLVYFEDPHRDVCLLYELPPGWFVAFSKALYCWQTRKVPDQPGVPSEGG